MKNYQTIRTTKAPRAFTLVELLVVISIIGVLAAFTIPALKSFKRTAVIKQTTAEMNQLITAIDGFKNAFGFYPSSNKNYDPNNPATFDQVYFSPLYFELLGTTNNNGTFQTLNGSASIPASALLPATSSPLGVSGFVNCMKPGVNSEDAPVARSFITDLKTKQYWIGVTNGVHPSEPVSLLIASVGGPDESYQPLNTSGLNPWRYVCPGVHNPNSYDLWVQLKIGGKTNLICNWNKQVTFNSPLP
jgi:prepilin-type N-terminal cleavage/methylation domain-containing protein